MFLWMFCEFSQENFRLEARYLEHLWNSTRTALKPCGFCIYHQFCSSTQAGGDSYSAEKRLNPKTSSHLVMKQDWLARHFSAQLHFIKISLVHPGSRKPKPRMCSWMSYDVIRVAIQRPGNVLCGERSEMITLSTFSSRSQIQTFFEILS